ncbi:MAG TPA: TIGR03086 family metal-binding protein [Iamia sp.]|nr:TIGR03086 family metal-binding protein [Iamia sp.]
MTSDLRPAHRAALDRATTHIDAITPDDLARPTPCVGWDLAALLAHMVGQNHGFAAAVVDGDAPVAAYAPQPWSAAAWRASADALVAAFAGADPDTTVLQVELAPGGPLPVSLLVGAQLLDTVVHTWDVTRALGRPFTPPADQVAVIEPMLGLIPDGDGRLAPESVFAPALPTDATDGWSHILTWLGRDPEWTPADA